MRAVIQRVSEARVNAKGTERESRISRGWLVLCGVMVGDTNDDAKWLADKVCGLRAFEDDQGKMNLSVQDVRGEILAVSQFTLCADTRKGRRPGFSEAARPEVAKTLFDEFVSYLSASGVRVATGFFQTDMAVSLCNDGPVTFILDSKEAP